MLEFGANLDATVADVQALCPQAEFESYRRAVGRIMGSILLDLMNPIYEMHPELKPKELEWSRSS